MTEVLIALLLLSLGIMGAGRLLIDSKIIQGRTIAIEKETLKAWSSEEEKRARGMTLLTVIMSMALGMVVLSGALGWHQITQKHYLERKGAADAASAARMAFQQLSRDLQASGYRGVRSRDPTFKPNRHMTPDLFLYPIDGRLVFGRADRKNDILIVYDVPRKRLSLGVNYNRGDWAHKIETQGNSGIRNGALVLMADYEQGDLFIANIEEKIKNCVFHQNSPSPLSKNYTLKDHTEILELQRIQYSVHADVKGKSVCGLYRKDLLVGSEQEIVRNVSGLKITYGIPSGDMQTFDYPKDYNSGSLHLDWPKVVSVHILIEILNKHTQKGEHFETTIALRNTPLTP